MNVSFYIQIPRCYPSIFAFYSFQQQQQQQRNMKFDEFICANRSLRVTRIFKSVTLSCNLTTSFLITKPNRTKFSGMKDCGLGSRIGNQTVRNRSKARCAGKKSFLLKATRSCNLRTGKKTGLSELT